LEGRGSTLEKEMPRDGIQESEHDQKVTDEVNRAVWVTAGGEGRPAGYKGRREIWKVR